MQGEVNMLNEIIAFAYAAVTTLLAFYIYKKHYINIKSKPFGLRTLAFIPLTLTYIIFFEIAFNSYRFFEPGFWNSISGITYSTTFSFLLPCSLSCDWFSREHPYVKRQ